MSVKAILSALFLGVIVAFIALNQKNACDISFGFTVLSGVPVYLTVLASFVVGMVAVLPLSLSRRRHSSSGRSSSKKNSAAESGLLNEASAARKSDGPNGRGQ